jgi:hypothetical protein
MQNIKFCFRSEKISTNFIVIIIGNKRNANIKFLVSEKSGESELSIGLANY